jgi:hypothetical protein
LAEEMLTARTAFDSIIYDLPKERSITDIETEFMVYG